MLPSDKFCPGTANVVAPDQISEFKPTRLFREIHFLPIAVDTVITEDFSKRDSGFPLFSLREQVGRQSLNGTYGIPSGYVPLMPAASILSLRRLIEIGVAAEGSSTQFRNLWIHLHECNSDHVASRSRSVHSSAMASLNVDAAIAINGPGKVGEDMCVHTYIIPCSKTAGCQSQDSGQYPGKQGRIPDDIWNLKQFPEALAASAPPPTAGAGAEDGGRP